MIEETQQNPIPSLRSKRLENTLAFITFGVTLIFLLTPSLYLLRKLNPYTIHFLFILLLVGFIAFITDKSKWMIACFLSAAALCLFLKSSFNQKLKLSSSDSNESFQVAHISLGNVEVDREKVLQYITHLPIDVICIQELSPDWEDFFSDRLESTYPYSVKLPRMDQYGQGMYAKYPIRELDTVWFDQIPAIKACVVFDSVHSVSLISCQVAPPVNQMAFKQIDNHLTSLASYKKRLSLPVVLIGEFHLPPWSAEVQKFKNLAELKDSRRDIHSRNLDGSVSLPKIPVDYILFGNGIDCSSFTDLGNSLVGRLGITGTYYFMVSDEKMDK